MAEKIRRHARAGIALIAVIGMAALTTACLSGGEEDDGTLKMVVWGGDLEKETYQERIDLLEAEHPDIKVDLQLIPSEQYEQKVQTMIAGGDGPDIMQVAEGVNVYSSKSQILPLDEYVSEAGLDLEERFGPAVGELYSYEDQVYAIPDRSGAIITYYNKDIFDAAGVEYPTAEWTWEDAQSAMEKTTSPEDGQWGYTGAGWWAQWWSFVYQNGGQIVGDDGKPAVNSPEAVEAVQWANDLVHENHYAPTAAEYADMGPDMGGDPLFASGAVALNTTGFWGIGTLQEADFNWGIAPLWGGDQQAATGFGSGLSISRDSANPDKAFEAIDFLTDVEGQEVIIDKAMDVPANIQVQQSEAFLKPEWAPEGLNMGAFAESSDFIYQAPFIPQWNEMQSTINDGLETFWSEGGDAQTELDEIQSQLETVVE